MSNLNQLNNYINEKPKISIVTPSYNQGKYLEETICSVVDQVYPNLEYVVIDGKSDDESIDIIRKYEERLSYWVSEPDNGQYHAINKGFSKTDGEIMAWLNSDDKYTPWTFDVVSEIFTKFPQIKWLTAGYPLHWDKKGQAVNCYHKAGFNKKSFSRGENLPGGKWYSRGWIQQETTFWRRTLWDKTGGKIDDSLMLAGDFELWAKFFQHADLYIVSAPLGGFRIHGDQKTALNMEQYLKEAQITLQKYGGRVSGKIESSIRLFFRKMIGHQAIPKDRLSSIAVELIELLPLFYLVNQCVWSGNEWQIQEAYIV